MINAFDKTARNVRFITSTVIYEEEEEIEEEEILNEEEEEDIIEKPKKIKKVLTNIQGNLTKNDDEFPTFDDLIAMYNSLIEHNCLDQSQIAEILTPYALKTDVNTLSSQCVKINADQTIGGFKTFSNNVQIFNNSTGQDIKLGKSGTFGDYGLIQYLSDIGSNTRFMAVGLMDSNMIVIHNNDTTFSKQIICNSNVIANNILEDNEERLSKVISDLETERGFTSAIQSSLVDLASGLLNLANMCVITNSDQEIYGIKTFRNDMIVNTINGFK
jgi:hypothetical protein